MKRKKILYLGIALLFCSTATQAQNKAKFVFSGMADMYYSTSGKKIRDNTKHSFLYNHNKLKEANINLAFVKLNYTQKNTRGNAALMAGTYAENNLAAEPTWARYIYEANVGVKISKKHNLWLDAGIMPSHIGFESANSQDCYTLTRSIIAENSPYYETGIKATYTNTKENLSVAALVLNGWQRIARPIGYTAPSFGTQVNYKPNENTTLNYSNFFGGENKNAFRTYQNFYYTNERNKKVHYTLGLDVGTEKTKLWYGYVAIVRYTINAKWKAALRNEFFKDKNGIVNNTYLPNALKANAVSLNADYTFYKKCIARLEYRTIFDKEILSNTYGVIPQNNITASVSVGF